MAEFPALPFWTDAYLADTRDLTAAQHGAYFLLLMTAWRTKGNCLPDDDDKLSRWASMDKRTWLKNKQVVMSFWCKIDGMFHQKRLDDERKRAEHNRNCQVQAGLASALKRKKTNSRHVVTDVPTESQPPSPSPSPTPSIEGVVSIIYPPLFERFWEAYPKKRRDSKIKSLPAYVKAIKKTTEEKLYEAVIGYAGSDEVRNGYAKGTIAWLNAERWCVDYSTPTTFNGKSAYGDSLANAARAVANNIEERDDLWA